MINKPSSGLSISTKFTLYFALFGILLISTFYLIFHFMVVPVIEDGIKTRLLDYAVIATNVIDKEAHGRIVSDKLGETSKEYLETKAMLQKIAQSDSQIESIYTLVPTNDLNTLYFVVDSSVAADKNDNGVIEDAEAPAEIMEPYDISEVPEMREGLTKPSVDQAPTTDKWGTFISAYAPLKTASGKTVGLVGVDLNYGTYQKYIGDFKNKAYLIFALVFLLCVLLGYLMGRGLVFQIHKIVSKVKSMSEDDSSDYLEVSGNDEKADLLAMINEMVRGLRENKQDLAAEVKKQTRVLSEKLADLEILNKMIIGREKDMMDLKKKIKDANG